VASNQNLLPIPTSVSYKGVSKGRRCSTPRNESHSFELGAARQAAAETKAARAAEAGSTERTGEGVEDGSGDREGGGCPYVGFSVSTKFLDAQVSPNPHPGRGSINVFETVELSAET
jgi:hypothetical protein